jgi:hypothetical protein
MGLGADVLASAGIDRLLGSLSFSVKVTDALTLAAVIQFFVAVARCISLATRDTPRPSETLRQD